MAEGTTNDTNQTGGEAPTGDNKENVTPSNNNRGGSNSKDQNRSGNNNGMTYNNNQPYSWKGRNESFGLILGLKSERYEFKTLFSTFVERLKNHALQEYSHGNDIVNMLEKYKDPSEEINSLLPRKSNLQSTKVKTEDGDEEEQDQYSKEMENMILKELVKNHIHRVTKLDSNKMKLYGLIWGQLTTGLQEVVKGDDDFSSKDLQFDCIWLLQKLKLITAGLDERSNKFATYVTAVRQAFTVRQRENESNDSYRKRFESHVLTLDLVGGKHVTYSPTVMQSLDDKLDPAVESDVLEAQQKTMGMMLILGADPTRFQSLQDSLEEGVLLGRDEYPETVTQAYELLQSTCPHLIKTSNRFSRFRKGGKFRLGNVSFAQVSNHNTTAGRDGKTYSNVKCHGCQEFGHYKNQCPKAKQVTLTQFVLNQKEMEDINSNWILLDSCSTVSVYKNKNLVNNIKACGKNEELHIITNGGSQTFPYTATDKLLNIPVHYEPNSLANILALSDVADIPGARITMDTNLDRAILLHVHDKTIRFQECQDGLYYYDPVANHKHSNKQLTLYSNNTSQYTFLQTVAENEKMYSRREVEGAKMARHLQSIIGFPSTSGFINIINNNLIRNCGVTADDITRADRIYGPPPPLLLGKSTRSKPNKVQLSHVPLPLQIQERFKNISLHVDFFYVNGHPFLHTKSEFVNFLTVQSGKTRTTASITQGLQTVLEVYNKRGFNVTKIFADNEFDIKSLHTALLPTNIHIYAAGEHCAVAERSIRTIKERCRCICHSIPFTRYTKLMVYSLVDNIIFWLNSFPSKGGASQTLSPAGIVRGRNLPNFNNKSIRFGAYAYAATKTSNDMKPRKVPCIALGPSNEWGGHYFMSLYTGKRIHSYDWDEVPIDEDVIARVETLAEEEGQPLIINKMPLFEWTTGTPIADADDDYIEIEQPPHEEVTITNATDIMEDIDIQDESNHIEIVDDETMEQSNDLGLDPDQDPGFSDREEEENPIDGEQAIESMYQQMEEELDKEIQAINDISMEHGSELDNSVNSDDSAYIPPSSLTDSNIIPSEQRSVGTADGTSQGNSLGVRRSTRSTAGKAPSKLLMDMRGKDYKEMNYQLFMKKKRILRTKKAVILTTLKKKSQYMQKNDSLMNKAMGIILAQQMSAKRGIKLFGEKAISAMIKEFSQLNSGVTPGKPVVEPVDANSLTKEQRKKALEMVNIIAEKRCGKLKGRSCADGSQQRKYLAPEESVASPTVSLESIISTLIIDAYEQRCVGIFDIPGAYLHTPVPEGKIITLKLRGTFVDIMCQVDAKYDEYVKYENGNKVLYLNVLRAIYGCIESAMLWYNLFSSTLESMGFTINPYDRCVANKMIRGKQCTIVWYVDDVKVSHCEEEVVDEIVKEIEKHFGPMKVNKNKTFDYLGMNVTFTNDRKIEIEMKKQIQEAIDSFGEAIQGEVSSPTPKHLFHVNDESVKLDKTKSDIFHSVTAKLLYLEKRARPDIEVAIAFLTTRVANPDLDDWKKLNRVLTYLHNTIDDVRVIGCDSLNEVFTWVDAAFAVHPNMRSQTGGVMSMGWGSIHAKSSKQKLNTKSSTESELVGVSEYIPYNIWLLNFLGKQGYMVNSNILYQDNESAIRMERNGRNSCTGNSRHVDIRFFFVKDRIDKNEVKIEYSPTYQMLADYFTKPLQGKSFHTFRNIIMGWEHISTLKKVTSPHMKERVGNLAKNVSPDLDVKYPNGVICESVPSSHSQIPSELLVTKNTRKRVTWDTKHIDANAALLEANNGS